MVISLLRPVQLLTGRSSLLSRFPRLEEQKQLLKRHFHAATPSALAALDHLLETAPEFLSNLAEGNYDELELIGFRFELVAETSRRVLGLDKEGLRLEQGQFVYDELAAPTALLAFTKRWHQALDLGYRDLWDLWNTAPVGYHTLNPQGMITAVNETEAKTLGYTPEGMLGQSIFDFIHPDQREIALQRFKQKLAGQTVPPVQDRIYIRRDGSEVNMSSEDSVILKSRGQVIGIKTVLVDVSRLRDLERQVSRLVKQSELGQLAAGFAHEFGNLITPILCSTRAVRDQLELGEGSIILRHLNNIIDAAATASRVVREIRQYASTSHSREVVSLVEPRQVVKQAINLMQETSDPSQPAITFSLVEENHWQIEGQEHQIFQTIFNLCLNAREAMPNGGQIELLVKDRAFSSDYTTTAGQMLSAGNYVALSVRDNGIGIQPERIKEVFEPFYTTKDFSDGTGLGLAVLLRIMDLHGGGVDLASQPEQGSKFTLFFPAIEPQPAGPSNGQRQIAILPPPG